MSYYGQLCFSLDAQQELCSEVLVDWGLFSQLKEEIDRD